MQRRTRARVELIRDLAEDGCTVEDIVHFAGFPNRDALSLFCRRHGLRDLYASLPAEAGDTERGQNQYVKREFV